MRPTNQSTRRTTLYIMVCVIKVHAHSVQPSLRCCDSRSQVEMLAALMAICNQNAIYMIYTKVKLQLQGYRRADYDGTEWYAKR
jgi:hypothetical protein